MGTHSRFSAANAPRLSVAVLLSAFFTGSAGTAPIRPIAKRPSAPILEASEATLGASTIYVPIRGPDVTRANVLFAHAVGPKPPGALVDIGHGQHIHVNCTGRGSPTVLLENGTGDYSVIWSLVQPPVATVTRVCSYDRGGYAWSDPGVEPRTFAQLALELHTALDRLHVAPPYVLVGQSYGGLVVRGFAARYSSEVVGMVLVDAVHEDQRVVWGGQPHRLRDAARGRAYPAPYIALDTEMIRRAHAVTPPISRSEPLPEPLERLPSAAQAIWRWADAQPMVRLAQQAETDWSPEEMARMHQERLSNRATLGSLALVVLARTHGDYPSGMSISADSLEKERRAYAADLARLSTNGELVYAKSSGHNIHIEDPVLVIHAIREVIRVAEKSR